MKKLIQLIFTLAILLSPSFAWAEEQTLPREAVEQVNPIDEQKLELAKKLTTWSQNTLKKDQTLVAVVARKGGADVRKHDFTGMAHSGLAVYNPKLQTWVIYNLVNSSKGANPQSSIYLTSLIDFFYGQTGYTEDALILIPDKPTQERMYKAFLNQKYKQLFFTDKYNLLSNYDSNLSLNCNKWILMNIVAARIDDYEPSDVLQTIKKGFEPGYIRLSGIELIFAKKKNNVRASELYSKNIPTVTIQSLYQSDLFKEKVFKISRN
jgi:hypothetical protein